MITSPGIRPAALLFTSWCTTADPRAAAVDACFSDARRGLTAAEFLDASGGDSDHLPSGLVLQLLLQKRTAECLGAANGAGTYVALEVFGPELWYRPPKVVWTVRAGHARGCHDLGVIDAYTGGITWMSECACGPTAPADSSD
jgi:hypothetical protein